MMRLIQKSQVSNMRSSNLNTSLNWTKIKHQNVLSAKRLIQNTNALNVELSIAPLNIFDHIICFVLKGFLKIRFKVNLKLRRLTKMSRKKWLKCWKITKNKLRKIRHKFRNQLLFRKSRRKDWHSCFKHLKEKRK